MSKSEKMLSVEEVLELVPGDSENAMWINPGFVAVVRLIKRTQTKAGKTMNICTLGSQTGAAEISMSVFSAIKFGEGDVIEVSGQGLRRTEYNGLQQVTMGQKTEIHLIGKAVQHEPPANAPKPAAEWPRESSGTPATVNGQTAGMAMKEALALAGMAAGGVTRDVLKDPLFWADVKIYAGNIIRISRALERGHLSPPSWPVKEQPAETEPEPAPAAVPAARRTQPVTEREAANQLPLGAEDNDETVPF